MVPAVLAISGVSAHARSHHRGLPGQPECTGVRQRDDPHLCDGRTIKWCE